MRHAIRIPQAGTSTEATFLDWDVNVGDEVKVNDLLGTAETDKVVLEIMAERDGVIDELIAERGQEIDVTEPLGFLKVDGAAAVENRPRMGAEKAAALADHPTALAQSAVMEERRDLPAVRRRIAENLEWVVRNTAMAWTAINVDYDAVEALRSQWKDEFRSASGTSLTYLPFVAAAACQALNRHEAISASIDMERRELVLRRGVNLGIGVAMDGGLLVPVVQNADTLGFRALAEAIASAISHARQRNLKPHELQGGTFTITNPGSLGSIMSVPIMNRGETAIMSVDAIEPSAVVVDGSIVVRRRGVLSLSFDHRIVDGAEAIAFLKDVRETVEAGHYSWS